MFSNKIWYASASSVIGVCAVILLSACDESADEPSPVPAGATVVDSKLAPEPPAPAVERVAWTYQPIGTAAKTLGAMTMMLPVGNVGNGRTLTFSAGPIVETELVSGADITKPVGAIPFAAVLGISEEALQRGGDPKTYLLKVKSVSPGPGGENVCEGVAPTWAILRQPDTPEDKSVTLVFLSHAPEEALSVACNKLLYDGK